jgi:hypothetical protein
LRGHSLDVVIDRRYGDEAIGPVTAACAFERPVLPSVTAGLALNDMSAIAALRADDRRDHPDPADVQRVV